MYICPKCGKHIFTWVSPPMTCDCEKKKKRRKKKKKKED